VLIVNFTLFFYFFIIIINFKINNKEVRLTYTRVIILNRDKRINNSSLSFKANVLKVLTLIFIKLYSRKAYASYL